jgi:hypothetical protein
MEQRPAIMSKSMMISATERSKQQVQRWIDLAKRVEQDVDKPKRLERHECKACFYSQRVGGAAITSRKCMCCDTSQTYGSTNTDVLCVKCAKEHALCKHCGGDLELRERRRNWPIKPTLDEKECNNVE